MFVQKYEIKCIHTLTRHMEFSNAGNFEKRIHVHYYNDNMSDG